MNQITTCSLFILPEEGKAEKKYFASKCTIPHFFSKDSNIGCFFTFDSKLKAIS